MFIYKLYYTKNSINFITNFLAYYSGHFNIFIFFQNIIGSTYLESELTNIGDYRRRTLSRCNSSLNYANNTTLPQSSGQSRLIHQPNSLDAANTSEAINRSNTNSNLLQIPNPNYLQIPRLSRTSLHRNQSLRRNSRRLSKIRMLSVESNEDHAAASSTLAAAPSNSTSSANTSTSIPATTSFSVSKPVHENLLESCINESESMVSSK